MAKETKTAQKKRETTQSPLADKYSKARVAKARDIVRAEVGKKRLSTPGEWAAVGEIAKLAEKHGKKLSLYKADRIAKRTKAEGPKKGYYTKLAKAAPRKKKR